MGFIAQQSASEPQSYPQPQPTGLKQRLMQMLSDPTLAALIGGPFGALGMAKYPASRIAINPAEMDPRRFMTVTENGLPFDMQKFPTETALQVRMKGSLPPEIAESMHAQGHDRSILDYGAPQVFDEAVKGLNSGHALRRAADNWPDATRIQITGVTKLKDRLKGQ